MDLEMISTLFALVIFYTVSVNSNEFTYKNSADELFKTHGVVPNVIPNGPKELAFVIYLNGIEAVNGSEVSPKDLWEAPAIAWDSDPDHYYTTVMFDPDEQTANDSQSALLHWLVANIQGHSGYDVQGEKIADYIGPAPGPSTGLHRYVFLVYQHSKKLVFDEPRINSVTAKGRAGFSITRFMKKYKLRDPVSGNFYRAKYDESVPLLRAQVGDNSLIYCLTGEDICK